LFHNTGLVSTRDINNSMSNSKWLIFTTERLLFQYCTGTAMQRARSDTPGKYRCVRSCLQVAPAVLLTQLPADDRVWLLLLPGSRPVNSRPATGRGCVNWGMLSRVPLLRPAIIGTCRQVENRNVWINFGAIRLNTMLQNSKLNTETEQTLATSSHIRRGTETSAVWFTQLEGQFTLSGVRQDGAKMFCIPQLEKKYAREVEDSVTQWPRTTGRYDCIKSEHIRRLSLSEEKRVWHVVVNATTGDPAHANPSPPPRSRRPNSNRRVSAHSSQTVLLSNSMEQSTS